MFSSFRSFTFAGCLLLPWMVTLHAAEPTVKAVGNAPAARFSKVQVTSAADAARLTTAGARLIGNYDAFQVFEASDSALAAAKTGSNATTLVVLEDVDSILLNAGTLHTASPALQAKRTSAARLSAASLPGKQLRLVQFAGPVQPAWYAALQATGAEIVAYIPNNAYLVYGEAPTLSRVQTPEAASVLTSAVSWEGTYDAAYKLDPAITRVDGKGRPTLDTTVFTVQMVADAASNPGTVGVIKGMMIGDLVKYESSLNYYNVVAALPIGRLSEIAARPDVVSIQPRPTPHKMDERQDMIISGNLNSAGLPTGPGYLNWLAARGFTQAQFTASNFAVDLSDSGIDNATTSPNHFGLYVGGTRPGTSRVIYNRLQGTANASSTLAGKDGHGNINSHIIGGYDDLSTVNVFADTSGYHYGLGVAPFVKIGSSVIFDPSTFTNPNYPNLQSQAYNSGARISSNSWGGKGNTYSTDSQAYDALVRDAQPAGSTNAAAGNQEMVIVFAAGNAGPAAGSLGEPSTAKNVLSVGASENVHPFGGSDGCGEPDTDANNANDVAPFSGRGPCSDGRVKPDIMAPGTHVTGGVWQTAASTTSGTGAADAFDGKGVCGGVGNIFFPAGQQFYTASSGTSHATPALSGACALLRQYFINQSLPPPSPAMTKAYLMNCARYMNGVSSGDTLPSNAQGMGLLDLGAAFDGGSRLLRDELAADKFTATGQTRTFTYTLKNPANSLHATLAWTDVAGSTTGAAYNNNLNLTVTSNGSPYLGNVFNGRNSVTGGAADAKNNVESVFLPGGVALGTVTITVTAANIVANGVPNDADPLDQDFALVVSEALTSPSLAANGAVLTTESVTPANSAVDPGEIVTVNLTVSNTGNAPTSNLTGTLSPNTGGVVSPGAAQTFGVIPVGGSVTRAFKFTASNSLACGAVVTPSLALQDGSATLGTVTYSLPTGTRNAAAAVSGSSPAAITIPAVGNATPYPSTIVVSGAASNAVVTKVTATLTGFSHTYPSDVGVLLVAPNGTQSVPLMYAVGSGTDAVNLNFTFDDAATASLPLTGALASGTFKPTVSGSVAFPAPAPTTGYGTTLAALNGAPVNGAWSLYVRDTSNQDGGSFTGWSLNLSTAVPVCADTSADVAVTSTLIPASPVAGQNFQLRYTVTNNSPRPASGVTVTPPFFNGFAVVGTSQSQGTFSQSGSALSFLLGQMAPLSTATCTITLKSPASNSNATYNLAGTASADQTDGNTNNNGAGGGVRISADTDGDGIPDQAESVFGLNPNDPADAALDLDGDGQSNLAEYLAGTTINNASSRLAITSTVRDNSTGAVGITFPSVGGRYYLAEYKNDLLDGGWTTLTDNIAGTDSPVTITDPGASGNVRRFYRVRLFVP